MRARRLIGAVAVVLAAATLGAGIAWAAFVGTTSNSANSFQAASCFSNTQRITSGTYTGDGVDARPISTGFRADFVMVKADTAQIAVIRTSTMSGDASKSVSGSTALATNRIEAITATGFTIGTNSQVNSSGTTYQYVAMKAGCGLKVGSYVGNGASSRAITGVGFQPELAAVLSAGAGNAVKRYAGMTRSFEFATGTGLTTGITSLDANGFTVGNAAETNTNGTVYHYAAFNDVAGSVASGTYTGDGNDNRNLGIVGFQPEYLMIRANDTATSRSGHHRSATLSANNSQFWAATANSTNAIQALQATGFQVGTDGSVNASGRTYHYIAFRNTGGGCSFGSTQTVSATSDSYVDESNPNSNYSTETTMRVRTRNNARNRRAFVQFSLPAVPSGCSLLGATLRLFNSNADNGRVIEARRSASAWTEAGIDWNNQPATTGPPATATSQNGTWMQWDVFSQVQAMYSGSNHGFMLRDETEDGPNQEQRLNTRENGTNPPELVLQFG